jgi:limonene-1,2-epoxide hydrolase
MAPFMAAWPKGDAARLSRFFSEDAEYCNGPLEAVHGREAIVAGPAQIMSLGGEVDADIRRLLSDGAVVMTEGVDYVRLSGRTAGLRIAGVFEVHEGVITGWRDDFDPKESGTSYPPTDRPGGAHIERGLGIRFRWERDSRHNGDTSSLAIRELRLPA